MWNFLFNGRYGRFSFPAIGVLLLSLFFPILGVNVEVKQREVKKQTTTSVEPLVGLHIPWAVEGKRLRDDVLEYHSGEWIDFKIDSIRLWDTRTAWLHLEQKQDVWDFSSLDANIALAQQNNVSDIILVLWGTPGWAASSFSENDAAWLGPGSASPPNNFDDWDDYVRTIVDRYRGIVSAYEIGNEPNASMFWRGTLLELGELTARAAKIIKETDPEATVIAPAPALIGVADVRNYAKYWTVFDEAGEYIDVVGIHWYPVNEGAGGLNKIMKSVRQNLKGTSLEQKPVWVTEINYRFSKPQSSLRLKNLPKNTARVASRVGVERLYWYAWTDMKIGDMTPLHANAPLGVGLKEYANSRAKSR
jgi:hypothetical protein